METSPKHARDVTNTSLKHPQLHWFAQRCTIYKFKLEFEILLRIPIKMFNVHHQTIKTQSRKQKNINDTTPSHHPLIINITEPWPHIMETSPKHARDVTNTSLKDPKTPPKHQQTTPKQHGDISKKRQRQDRDITETSPKQHRDITETPPKRHWDITETSQQSITKTAPRHHHDTTETTPRRHRNIIATSPRHQQSITKTMRHHRDTPRHHPSNAKPRPTHHGDKTETRPRAWIFQSWSFLRRHTGHSYTGLPKGAQYTNSNRNLRFCLETRSKCSSMFIRQSKHHHPRKKQHCNINETTPSHHPLIINITAPSPHIMETSPKHARDVTNTSLKHPQLHWFAQRCTIYKLKLEFEILLRNPIKMFINVHHQTIKTQSRKHKNINDTTPSHHPLIINITEPSPHITETSPKHARDVTNTSLKDPEHTTKKTTKEHQNNTETSPKKDRDKTETRPRHDRDITKTTPRHHQDKTKTRPRHDRDKTETRPRHDRDMTGTSPRQHQNNTETSPKKDRDKTETRPTALIFQSWSFLRRHTGHSYTGLPKGAQYTNSNRNLRFCLETRSKCSMFIRKSKHHHQRNKNSTATSTRQHQAITHSS